MGWNFSNLDSYEVLQAVQDGDNQGFCLMCGAVHFGCEPDMRAGECQDCEENFVYGAEELLIMGVCD